MPSLGRLAALLPLAALVAVGPAAAPAATVAATLFQDDFEQARDPPWRPMEEPGPCHVGSPVGEPVAGEAGRSEAAKRAGAWGYQVFANKPGLVLPNHAYGAYLVDDEVGHVAPLRYEVWASRDPSTNETTQAGPEFGVQVTREVGLAHFRTTTFGFQFSGSPDNPPNWSLWVEDESDRDEAEWRTVHARWLEGGTWYRFVLEADLTIPAYRSLVVEGPDWTETVPVEGLPIAREAKGFVQNATWVHVDATSLWNTCGLGRLLGAHQARVWYDDVRLDLLDE